MGRTVGAGVGSFKRYVGANVVGTGVGAAVGFSVGVVGSSVGENVGAAVGDAVGSGVGDPTLVNVRAAPVADEEAKVASLRVTVAVVGVVTTATTVVPSVMPAPETLLPTSTVVKAPNVTRRGEVAVGTLLSVTLVPETATTVVPAAMPLVAVTVSPTEIELATDCCDTVITETPVEMVTESDTVSTVAVVEPLENVAVATVT